MTADITFQVELLDTGETFNGLSYDESYTLFEKYKAEGHRPVVKVYPTPTYRTN